MIGFLRTRRIVMRPSFSSNEWRNASLFALATKIGDPRSVGLRFGARGESFAAQLLDQRCREKWRNDCESLAGLESIHTLANFGKWFDAIAQHAADIEALKGGLRHG